MTAKEYYNSTRLVENPKWTLAMALNFAEEYNKSENNWISVSDKLPNNLQTVWLTNGKGWVSLGCLIDTPDGWHWGLSNGVIYQEKDEIVSECESDDLDVLFWHPLPKAIFTQ